MEAHLRPEQVKSLPQGGEIQDETPETIRTSLQQGEWVTSVDFKDDYFHIPIQEQSRKYLRFHVQGQTYQFKALPFGLSTAPLEFTVVAKEVKLMVMHKGIRIHQYLDDCLVRARSHQVCLQHTKDLVKICQGLGWLVNLEKSELEPKQVFDFVGYQFDLRSGRVRPTPDRWQTLRTKIQTLLALPTCPVRQFMSLIGLLTATEKQVHLGRLHAIKTCSADLYRCIKRRVGRSLKRAHGQRLLVTTRKQRLISTKMKISHISWIVSTETDPKARGESQPGTSPCFYTS